MYRGWTRGETEDVERTVVICRTWFVVDWEGGFEVVGWVGWFGLGLDRGE